VAQIKHGQDGEQRHDGEHAASAEAVGEGADRDAAEGPDDDRDGDQQCLLERGRAQLFAQGCAQRGQQGPRPEREREPDGGYREHPGRLPGGTRRRMRCCHARPEPAAVLRFSGESVPITAVPSVFSAFGRVWCARANAPQV
jgi:hypothetical protein